MLYVPAQRHDVCFPLRIHRYKYLVDILCAPIQLYSGQRERKCRGENFHVGTRADTGYIPPSALTPRSLLCQLYGNTTISCLPVRSSRLASTKPGPRSVRLMDYATATGSRFVHVSLHAPIRPSPPTKWTETVKDLEQVPT